MAQARTLHENEIKQVLEFLKTKKYGYRDRAMLMVSHLSGMRVGEIASLTVGHVMDANGNIKGEIRLTADETKGKHPRTVFINSRLKEEFKKYFENSIS